MLDNSNIEIKITNSAKLLECNYKDNELFQNNAKKKNKKLKKDNRTISPFYHTIFLLKQKYPKILLFFEKYAQFYINYKYSTDGNFYSIKVINDIIGNEPTHIVAEFKDYLIYGDDSEFLHNFYKKEDSKKHLPKIFDYYNKCSVIFPNYVVFPESKYIFKNIKKKQKVIDIQQEQEYKKELLLKGELDYDDNDDLFTTGAIFSILDQTNTSNIRQIFGVDKNCKTYGNIEPNKNIENDNNNFNNTSTRKLIDILHKEIKKKKEKEQKSKIIKAKQILNLKSSLKSKLLNNKLNIKINNKGRNNQINEVVTNFDNKNIKDNSNNFYYTNINFKNKTLNKIKKSIQKPRLKSNSKSKRIRSKEKQNSKINNNFINYKNSNIDKALKNNYIYSFITDSKTNHISTTKKNIRTKSKIKNKNNTQLNNNSSGKNKKTIKEYFKRKISPKAIIIKMIIENNKNRLTSPRNGSINKKEKFNNKKKPVSLTPSLTNINMISHKTKKIYNRNTNSIVNIKQKNKIFKKKVNIISNDKKFKSLIMKDRNNSNSNYNPDTVNTNNILPNSVINNNTNDNNLATYNNNRSSGNNITRNDISMNLYKVNSFSNIQKVNKTKKYSKIKSNRHNSTLTGTTTCSYMKHSSINYEKKTAKPIKRRHIFYQNEILLNDAYNKPNSKNKYHNNISKQFSINNNSNNNKINVKTENKNIKCFSKNMLSPSPSIGFINNKKDFLYEKLIRRKIGILPIKKTYFNFKYLGSPFTSRIRLDTSRTRMMKNTINIDKMYSIYRKKRKIDFKNLKNKSYNFKSVKIIKEQINNSINNKRMYLNTYYDFYNSKK